jgi:hypothetical protein
MWAIGSLANTPSSTSWRVLLRRQPVTTAKMAAANPASRKAW